MKVSDAVTPDLHVLLVYIFNRHLQTFHNMIIDLDDLNEYWQGAIGGLECLLDPLAIG
jgi:hypothetical protein